MKQTIAILALLIAVPLGAQQEPGGGWTGSIGFSLVTAQENGNPDSFRTQSDLGEGAMLDEIHLTNGPILVRANGFGADSARNAELRLRFNAPWTFSIRYDARSSFFALRESPLLNRGQWDIERWVATGTYDGLRAARLGLTLRRVSRDDRAHRPVLGLNEIYPIFSFAETESNEATLSFETKTLPVRLRFEQTLTRYERRDRRSATTTGPLVGTDPDAIAGAESTRVDEWTVPATRLIATWGSVRAQFAGSFVYAPAELDARGFTSTEFALDNGARGRVVNIDDIIASGNRDTLSGNFRLAYRVAPRVLVRLYGDARDTETDLTMTGERIIRMIDPGGGSVEITGTFDARDDYHIEDRRLRAEAETGGERWSVWAGGFAATRDVSNEPGRDTSGLVAGFALHGRRFRADAELERGAFTRFETETANRLTFRVRGDLGRGFDAHLQTRFQESEGDDDAISAGVGWSSATGVHGFGVDLDRLDLDTPTGYDLSVFTTTAHARTAIKKLRLSGSLSRSIDDGETWPLDAWSGRARVGWALRENFELGVFSELFAYDEDRADGDDFDVSRFGVSFLWRLQ